MLRSFAVLAVLLPAAVFAQTRPAPPPAPPPQGRFPAEWLHSPDDRPHSPVTGEELVDDARLKYLAGLMNKSKNQQKDLDSKKLQDLVQKMTQDEQGQDQLKKMLKDNPQLKDPKFLEQLEKLSKDPAFFEKIKDKLPIQDQQKVMDDPQALKDKLKDFVQEAKKFDGPSMSIDVKEFPKVPKVDNSAIAKDHPILKWAEKNFGDTELGKEFSKDLVDVIGNSGTKGLFDGMPEFSGDFLKDLDFKPDGPSTKFDLPDLKGSGLTNPSTSGGGSSGIGSIGSGGGGLSGGGGGGGVELGGGAATAFAVIMGIVAAIFIALVFFRKWQATREARAEQALARANSLDFSRIKTREELVEAFETVSLTKCGDDARNWNHRVIAEQIGDQHPTQAEPADELGRLYEVARYAPPEEDLAPTDYDDARRNLTTLAGGRA